MKNIFITIIVICFTLVLAGCGKNAVVQDDLPADPTVGSQPYTESQGASLE